MKNLQLHRWLNYTHGLELYPDINRGHRQNENGILFFVEMCLLKKQLNILTEQDRKDFIKIVDNLQVKGMPGLFDRGQGESDPDSPYYESPEKRRIISHDNLTAISVGSKLFKTHHAKDIAKHMLKYLGRFDNKHPYKQKVNEGFMFHPRDWFMYLYNAGGFYKLLSWVFFPIFVLAALESISSKETCRPDILRCLVLFFKNKFKWPKRRCFVNTSGPWLWFVRLSLADSLPLKLVRKLVFWGYKRQFGDKWINEIAKIYFGQSADNPIRILAEKI